MTLHGPPDRITALGANSARKAPVDSLVRVDFAVDVQLAQAARDQLRHLAAEVDDQKAVMLGHVDRDMPAGTERQGD